MPVPAVLARRRCVWVAWVAGVALRWIGVPQVLALDFVGHPVTVLNTHPSSGVAYVREREAQARAISAFVAAHPGPLVLGTDFNATDRSTAYGLLTVGLRDAWR